VSLNAAEAAPQRALTLKQTMQLAAKRNLSLLSDRLERRRKALEYDAALSTFLPQLSIDTGYDNSTPFDRSLAQDQRLRYGASVDWTAPIGTRVSLGATVDQRLRGATRQSQSVNTANHSSNIALSVTQPLLKGAGTSGAASALAEARLDREIQRQVFREQLNTLLHQVEQAYWALAFSQLEVGAKTGARDRAKKQFEETKENIRRGILADIEIYLVEENLVFFQQELVKAEQRRELAQRALAELLQLDPRAQIRARQPLADVGANLDAPAQAWPAKPKSSPRAGRAVAAGAKLDAAAATRRGVQGNPGLAAEQLRLEKERVKLRFETNQALPSLDLAGSLRLNGLDSDYAEHLSQVVEARRPELSVGLTLTLPLSFRANRARVSKARLAVEKQLLRLKAQEIHVRHEAGRLVKQIGYEQRRLALAKRRLSLSRLKLEAELKKYKNGISTLDSIVRFQRELDQAALGVWRVQQELLKSRGKLQSLSGALHSAHGIKIGG
jgi:outer membrane protein TolC